MLYAKIDDNGNVVEFPFRFPNPNLRMRRSYENDLPSDVVSVDVETNRPVLRWDQKCSVDSVVKTEDKYVAVYTDPVDKFSTSAEKLKCITTLKKQHEGTNERTFTFKVKELKSSYNIGESESWTVQRSEAQAYNLDNTVSTPLLSSISSARGISVGDLVAKILANVETYDSAYGSLLGKYQKNKDILASIDLSDESTWNSIDLVESI